MLWKKFAGDGCFKENGSIHFFFKGKLMASWNDTYHLAANSDYSLECSGCGYCLYGCGANISIECVSCFYKHGAIHPSGGTICFKCFEGYDNSRCEWEPINPIGYPDGCTCVDCGEQFNMPSSNS